MLGQFLQVRGDASGIRDFALEGIEIRTKVYLDGQEAARGGLDEDLGQLRRGASWALRPGEVRGTRRGGGALDCSRECPMEWSM